MTTAYRLLRDGENPDITVDWWVEEKGGAIKLYARAQDVDGPGADQVVLALVPDGAPESHVIECDLLARVLGFSNLKDGLL